ncbi:DNA replication ATP-dependent helicase/nuclease DNA2-like isoform X2 [Rhopilema esculentum]
MSRAYFASQPSKGKFTFGKESKKRSFEHDSSGISPLKKKLASKISALESQEISRKMHGELLCAEIPIDTVGESRVTSQASGKKEDEEVVKSSACNAVRSRKSLKLSKDISKKIRFTMTESSSQGRIGRSESKSNNVTCDGYLDEENDQDVIASYGCSKMNISKEVPSHEKENRGECHQEGLVDFVRNHGVAHDGIVDNDTANCSNDSFAELLEDFDMSIGNWELSSNQQVASNKGLANDSSHNTEAATGINDSILNMSLGSDFECPPSSPQIDSLENEFTVNTVLVLEVLRQEASSKGNLYKPEKLLRLFDEETSQEAICILREDWEGMEVCPGDSVHITGHSLQPGETLVLDNSSPNYLVLFPDTLVSGTTISMGITCPRRAVLSELFKTDGPNEVMFLGTFLHELFDFFIQGKDFGLPVLERRSSQLLSQYDNLNTIYSLGIDYRSFMEKVRELCSAMSRWARKFLKAEPCPSDDIIDFKRGSEAAPESDARLSVSNIVDIEENILCPSLGLKGKIDASVTVKIHREKKGKESRNKSSKCLETYLLPLELKTGKMFSKLGSIEHRAQVILYTLMMSEKYDKDIDAGLLYYLKTGHLQGVPATVKERRSLIIKRNELARYLSKENQRSALSVPGLLKNERTCKRCPAVNTCMVFHKSVEQGTKETSGVGNLFEEVTGHLTEKELEYFVKWYRLLMLEGQEEFVSNGYKEMWAKTSEKKEKSGKCFSKMKVKTESKEDETLWTYSFCKCENKNFAVPLNSLSIGVGDRVVISEENCKTFGLCTGYIHSVTNMEVHIQCRERIRPRGKIYDSIFRIEKDESLSGQKIPLGNLMKLLLSSTEADAKLRKLIIEFVAPKFSLVRENEFLEITGKIKCPGTAMLTNQNSGQKYLVSDTSIKEIARIYHGLNPDQARAVRQCLSAEDYVMILGMPGTGKTTTIACLVNILTLLGKSVLIASYTHSAVDNILLKLKKMNLDFIRLGNKRSIHEEIRPFLADEAAKNIKSIEGLHHFYNQKNIVATTCLGINHPLFLKKRFDYCIVDEASQITQPVCFGAIRNSDVFVLVGDHYQLPPLVQSVEARHSGMDVSLFRLLSEKHPSAIASLRFQYRMHRDIMSLANTLVYGHRMQCGSDKIATHILRLQIENSISSDSDQLLRIIDPSRPVVFINTDSIPCLESMAGKHIQNEGEASILSQIVYGLMRCGVDPSNIGVISPFRNQLKVIKESLTTSLGRNVILDLEINTVDKYQGRDKSCIIVSFVRSNSRKQVGELLKDWRRVNVAVTRAKQKLIMVGSRETLTLSPVLGKMIEYVDARSWLETADKNLVNCLQL